jgi:YggT family protein
MTRTDIADFLSALLTVYTIILVAYIVINLLFAVGARPGYYRWLDSVLGFLRDVSEPYLSIFRRVIPPLGPIDISPMIAILVLQIVGGIVVNVVAG